MLLVILGCASALAQTITGSIAGTVTDNSGAAIRGAVVTATESTTNITTTTTTNEEGIYALRFLHIGTYKVVVEAQGFANYNVGPFALEINQQLKVDAKLSVAGTTASVSVTADTVPLLNAENGTINSVVDSHTIESIPVNGRNFTQLTQFMPGIALTNQNQWNGATGSPNNSGVRQQSVATAPSINGNRMVTNNYTLDGIQFFDTGANFSNAFGLAGYNPSPDAIEQVTVVSTNPAAEFGSGSGGQIMTVLKSGTNKFHGSVFDYLQNWHQDANTFGNKRNTPHTARSKYTQQTFGGTVGGPILHDKLFFFADYSGYRKPSSGQGSYNVAPQAFRNGDFSVYLSDAYKAATGKTVQLYDSQNGFAKFANNQVTIQNPVAKYLFAHPEIYPLPNQTSTAADGIMNNYLGKVTKSLQRNDQGDVKVDWKITPTDSVFGRVSVGRAWAGNSNTGIPVSFPLISEFPFTSAVGNYVHVFSPTVINEFRAGFTRIAYNSYNQDYSGVFGTKGDSIVGIPLSFTQNVPGFTLQTMSGSETTNGQQVSDMGTTGSGRLALDNNFEYDDMVSIERGHHLLKAGVQLIWYQNNFQPNTNGALGSFGYNGYFTGDPAAGQTEGYDFADFVLGYGYKSAISIGASGRVGLRQWRSAYFFQDDWKITPNLTLNLGLRYEFDQPAHEVHNKIAKVDIASGSLVYAGLNGASRALYNPFHGQVDPRFGFAYQVNPRMVLRGGFSSVTFMDFNTFVGHATNPPYSSQATATATIPTKTAGGSTLNPASGFTGSAVNATSYNTWPDNLRPAFVPSYDLTVEYQLSNTQSLMFAYVGNIGNHLLNLRNINQLHSSTDTTAPYSSLVGKTGSVNLYESEGKQNYSAGEIIYRKRAGHGLTFTTNYTYGKNLTNAQGYAAPSNISGGSNFPQNAYDLNSEYGPAGFDIRQNLTSTWVAELPFGRGQLVGRNMNRWVDAVVGGWKISGNATLYSGFPVTIQASNVAGVNQSTGRANHYRKLKVTGRKTTNWWGTDASAKVCAQGVDNGSCAYGIPAAGTFGNAGIGTERSAGFRGIDAAGFKTITIEGQQLQFRVDAYNVGNISSYNNPGRSASATTGWGLVQSTRSQQRQIQFALKYQF